MIALIEDYRTEIAVLCRRFGVRKLEVFGSATTDAFDPATSGIDVLDDFADRSPGYARRWLGRHQDLCERLEELIGHWIDLVFPDALRHAQFRDHRRVFCPVTTP